MKMLRSFHYVDQTIRLWHCKELSVWKYKVK